MANMLIASCRKDFWSPTEFSSADEFRRIDLVTGTGRTVPHTDVLNELSNKRVMLLIHGYNNEELDVLKAYRTIDTEMRLLGFFGTAAAPYDAIVGYAWPGGAVGASFPFARLRAGESAPRFARLLSDLRSTGASIDLNSHSLGAHVVLEALRDGAPQIVRNAWTFAPAVDNESIEFNERYFSSSQRCQTFYVFHSKERPRAPSLVPGRRPARLRYGAGLLRPGGPGCDHDAVAERPRRELQGHRDVPRGYRSSGQVWAYISQELANPSTTQFVTLTRTTAAMTAVFRSAMGSTRGRTRSRRAAPRTRAKRSRSASR